MNVVSGVYPTSISKAGTLNQQNQNDSNELKSIKENNMLKNVVEQALEARSINDANMASEQRAVDVAGYSKIVNEEDSILQNQTDNRALAQGAPLSDSPRAEAARNWKPEPSFYDMVTNKLADAFNWNSEQPTGAANFNDPNQELRLREEAEYNKQLGQLEQQAGLSEIEQKLNNREY
jgi:hypothetical protein